jgi:ribosomal protein L15
MKGFKSHFVKPITISLAKIQGLYADGDTVTLISLVEHGIIKPKELIRGVKIVGTSEKLTKKLVIGTDDPNLTSSKTLAS